ncbi:MAG: D-glycerate dehydrogenase [Azospirillaceae bacterium]
MADPPIFVATRRLTPDVEARLARDYDFRGNPDEDNPVTGEALLRKLQGADVLITTASDRFDAGFVDRLPASLRMVGHFGIGTDGIPVAAIRERGLAISNTPSTATDDVADLAMGLIVATARRFAEGDRLVRAGAWRGITINFMLGQRVAGKRLGLVGFGAIGQALARRARGFGMSVAYTARNPRPETEAELGASRTPLDDLLATSDVVVLACPLTPATHHLIDQAALARMKPDALLINVARGPVVDEAALVAALQAGRIAGAGLDVYEFEPAVTEALKALDNTVLLPHLGTASLDARNAMGFTLADNIDAFMRTGKVLNPVGG